MLSVSRESIILVIRKIRTKRGFRYQGITATWFLGLCWMSVDIFQSRNSGSGWMLWRLWWEQLWRRYVTSPRYHDWLNWAGNSNYFLCTDSNTLKMLHLSSGTLLVTPLCVANLFSAICDPPCVYGDCVAPDECQCDEGYMGVSCESRKDAVTQDAKYCYTDER